MKKRTENSSSRGRAKEGPIFGLLCSVSVFFLNKETSPIPHPSGATDFGVLSAFRITEFYRTYLLKTR